jgi:hypothetical protein
MAYIDYLHIGYDKNVYTVRSPLNTRIYVTARHNGNRRAQLTKERWPWSTCWQCNLSFLAGSEHHSVHLRHDQDHIRIQRGSE